MMFPAASYELSMLDELFVAVVGRPNPSRVKAMNSPPG
jgi:hypothetical protein